jgi:hypothetical protein
MALLGKPGRRAKAEILLNYPTFEGVYLGKYMKLYKRLKPLNYTRQKPPSKDTIIT